MPRRPVAVTEVVVDRLCRQATPIRPSILAASRVYELPPSVPISFTPRSQDVLEGLWRLGVGVCGQRCPGVAPIFARTLRNVLIAEVATSSAGGRWDNIATKNQRRVLGLGGKSAKLPRKRTEAAGEYR